METIAPHTIAASLPLLRGYWQWMYSRPNGSMFSCLGSGLAGAGRGTCFLPRNPSEIQSLTLVSGWYTRIFLINSCERGGRGGLPRTLIMSWCGLKWARPLPTLEHLDLPVRRDFTFAGLRFLMPRS